MTTKTYLLAIREDHLPDLKASNGVAARSTFRVTRTGSVAVLPIHGAMVKDSPWWGELLTDHLNETFKMLADDSAVSAILLDVHSPGGEVMGLPEFAASVAEASKHKPVYALADSMMASGAYWIGSQAKRIYASPSAEIGSVGVIAMHMDVSAMAEAMGVKVTVVKSVKNKAEFNQFEPLSAEADARLRSVVSDIHDDFIKAIASGRRMSMQTVRETFGDGRVFSAKEALKIGMIDGIATFGEVMDMLQAKGRAGSSGKASAMVGV